MLAMTCLKPLHCFVKGLSEFCRITLFVYQLLNINLVKDGLSMTETNMKREKAMDLNSKGNLRSCPLEIFTIVQQMDVLWSPNIKQILSNI